MDVDDDWIEEPDELASAPELPLRPRRRLTPLTGGLLAVLLVALGFVGGVLVQKGQGGQSSAGGGGGARLAAALASARGGGSGAGGAAGARGGASLFGGAGGAGGATFGTVATVDGDTLYVTDAQGNTLKVTAAKGASVTRSVDSSVRAIRPGSTVVVQGAAQHGAIVATSIRATPAGQGGGLGLGGGGAGSGSGGGGVVNQLFGGSGGGGGGGTGSTTKEAP